MAEPTDEELMERFCDGDGRAFEALYARHARPVQSFLQRMVGDAAAAEDLLQVSFLSVIRSPDRWRRGSRVAPWLFSIAANAARDALRRRRRTPEDPGADVPERPSEETPSDPVLQQRLSAALQELPLPQREAVVLHRVLGWTFEEMSGALGVNAATLRVRAHRGEERLRQRLGGLWEGA